MLEQFNNLKHKDVDIRIGALSKIVKDCSNAGKDKQATQSFDYAFGRLVKGLQSQLVATRQEFYAGLVVLLHAAAKVETEQIVDSIEKILGGSGGDTKSEKRLRTVANILAHGAVIRARLTSKKTFNVALATKILNNLVAAVEKKKAFISLASPFVAHLLIVHPDGTFSDEILSGLRAFLHKAEGGHYDADQVKLILTAELRGLTPSLGSLDNVEELVDALKTADPNDKQLLNLVFEHVHKRDFDEEFWTTFMSKIGPFDFQLFCSCICESVKSGCSLRILLTEEKVKLGLSVLHKKDLGTEAKDKAVEAFSSLLTWSEGKCDLTSKEKKKALKVLYKKTPNLLFEYQVLRGVIRNHLEYLSEKELEYLASFMVKSVSSASGDKVSVRGQLTSIAFLNTIGQLKKLPATARLDIAKLFSQLGFCKPRSQEEVPEKPDGDETDLENVQQQALSHFVSLVESASDLEFVRSLFEYVKSLVDDTEETYQLRKPLTDEIRNLWKRGNKLLKKIEDEVVTLITLAGAMQLISGGNDVSPLYEEWLELVKKSKKDHGSQFVIVFIVDQVVGTHRPFFNYEWVFKRFAMEGKVTEEAIQSLADAIEPGDEFGEDDDEDDDDMDDEVSDEEEDEDEENIKMANGRQPNGTVFSTPAALKAGLQNGDGSDSEETIDMDEATEEDLKKMDEALAAVFAAKRKAKDDVRLEGIRYLRVLSLVDILLGRYKEPPISAVLILLMPLISSVKHNLNDKSKQSTLTRTLKTLTRLNKFKKFSGMDEVEPDVLSTMADEIRLIMKKKPTPPSVKDVLAKSMKNLLGSGNISGENVNIASEENSKAEKKKNKKQKKNNAPDLAVPINSASETPQSEGESKMSKKKKKEKNKGGNVEKVSLPAKRKAQGAQEKKKAKYMRMQVLSEGLSNDV